MEAEIRRAPAGGLRYPSPSIRWCSIFYLVMTTEPIAALARTAAARAVMLDAREAPQREAARERKKRTTAALRRRKLD
jgi:hypothetical protein